jgi:hypothetical protein
MLSVLTHHQQTTSHWRLKSAISATHSTRIASFCPFAAFHIENHVFAIAEVLENLRLDLFCAEL